VLRELHRKMDEIIGRQERTLSLIGASSGHVQPSGQVHGHGQGQGQGQPTGQPMMMDTIRRHEIEAILANQMEIVGSAREIKGFVTEINQKSNTILSNQGKGGNGGGAHFDQQTFFNEMRDNMNNLKKEVASYLAKSTACPTQQTTSCMSTTVFLVFLTFHLIIMLGYFIYRDNKEAQAKKFY